MTGLRVGEEDQSGGGTGLAKIFGEGEHVGEADAPGDGALAGTLDDRAIGDGIGEGNAEFEHVGAVVQGGEGDVAGGGEVWVAHGEVGDDAGLIGEMNGHRRRGRSSRFAPGP